MISPRRRKAVAVGAVLALAAGVVAWKIHDRADVPAYRTAAVDRGDLLTVVGATGTLEAVTTVQVGSQVSGVITSLHADFNDQVRKGQVLARLDVSALQARVDQARASLLAAQAGVERTRAEAGEAQRRLARSRELSHEGLLPAQDLDTAASSSQTASAQVRSAQASVAQAAASVRQAEVDLGRAVITSPIDGVVVARSVDVGQTVAASLSAPTLFVIAQDLARMQVVASIDEADVGRVQTGQEVTFTVDAWPQEEFHGRVREVRLQPTVAQGVVTYSTIIDAENPGLKLKPGMTATVSIVIESREDVLRVPSGALTFRPEGFDPATAFGGQRRAGGSPQPGGGGSRRGNGEGRANGEGRGGGQGRGDAANRPRLVFLLKDGKPEMARVKVGGTDGRFVEITEGLKEGDVVIVGTEAATSRPGTAPRATGSNNPFAPGRPPQGRTR